MVNVTVVFTNGSIVSFAAQEFDADLVSTYGENSVKKFPYKDAKDQGSVIHLRLKDVLGLGGLCHLGSESGTRRDADNV